jgi:opacity protein-like surface antigen
MPLKSLLAALFIVAAVPIQSQVVPAATEGGLPLEVGAGFSNYATDWGHTRMSGGGLWIDYNFNRVPYFMHGIGVEAEAHTISADRPKDLPTNFRQDTAGGGAIYTWRHYHNFHPYGKFLVEFGSIDFLGAFPRLPYYSHDTRTVYAPGGGVEYRVFRNIWVRGDYEYQMWPHIFQHSQTLDPTGFTIGASYDFKHMHAR